MDPHFNSGLRKHLAQDMHTKSSHISEPLSFVVHCVPKLFILELKII